MNRVVEMMIEQSLHIIEDYIIPGMTSYLLKRREDGSTVRLFVMTRSQMMFIAPHSHRFDLRSTVLEGRVLNTMWYPKTGAESDCFRVYSLEYKGKPGDYEKRPVGFGPVWPVGVQYWMGDSYFMTHSEIHNIWFARGSAVLIDESEPKSTESKILEPFNQERQQEYPLFRTAPWMFHHKYVPVV